MGLLRRALVLCSVTAGACFSVGAQVPADASQGALLPEPAGTSQVRVVRLSQVQGLVQMDRAMGRGYEQAIVNMPVVGHARLRTGQGVAEVEFEDNSSLRLAPGSEVRFSQLSRSPDGATLTTVEAIQGTVYVSLRSTRSSSFALNDGAAHMVLTPGTHLRLHVGDGSAALAVWQGRTDLQLGGTETSLGKKQSLAFDPTQSTVSTVNGGVEEASWDSWDHDAAQYHDVRANQTFGVGSAFGAGDLGAYGSFADLPGCGSVWQPYLVGAGWSPYDNGSWALYQGGYSWVSPYPWGWLPYHSGSWVNCGGAGWGWRPGAQWYGLNNGGALQQASGGTVNAPRLPGRPVPFPVRPGEPGRGTASLVPVSTRPLAKSGVDDAGEHFIFRQNSAGLGVPRSGIGNMQRTSLQAEQHGVVARSLMSSPALAAGSARAGGAAWGSASSVSGAAPQSMHRSAASSSFASGTSSSAHTGSVTASSSVVGSSGSVQAAGSGGGGSSAHSH